MHFPSALIPAALLFFGAAVVSARPVSEVATKGSAENENYSINAILRYRQKEKRDVQEIVVGAAE